MLGVLTKPSQSQNILAAGSLFGQNILEGSLRGSKYSGRAHHGSNILAESHSGQVFSQSNSRRLLTASAILPEYVFNPINIPPPQTIERRDPTFSVKNFTSLTNSFRFADIYVLLASAGVTAEDKSLSASSRPQSSPP